MVIERLTVYRCTSHSATTLAQKKIVDLPIDLKLDRNKIILHPDLYIRSPAYIARTLADRQTMGVIIPKPDIYELIERSPQMMTRHVDADGYEGDIFCVFTSDPGEFSVTLIPKDKDYYYQLSGCHTITK